MLEQVVEIWRWGLFAWMALSLILGCALLVVEQLRR